MSLVFEEKSYHPFPLSNIYGLIDLSHLLENIFIVISLNGKISAVSFENNYQPRKPDTSTCNTDFELELINSVDLIDVCDGVSLTLIGDNVMEGGVQLELEVTCCCLLDDGDRSTSAHLAIGFVVNDIPATETSNPRGYFWIGTLSKVEQDIHDLARAFQLRKTYNLDSVLPLFAKKTPVYRDWVHDQPRFEQIILVSQSDGSLSCYRQMGNRVDSPDSADRCNARPRFTAGLVDEMVPELTAENYPPEGIDRMGLLDCSASSQPLGHPFARDPPGMSTEARSMSVPADILSGGLPSGAGSSAASSARVNSPLESGARLKTITALDFWYNFEEDKKITLVGYQTGHLVLYVTCGFMRPTRRKNNITNTATFDTAISVIKCFHTTYFGVCGMASSALGPVMIYRDLSDGDLIPLCVLEESYQVDVVMGAALCPLPPVEHEELFDQDEMVIHVACFNKSLLSWRLNSNGITFEREIPFNTPLFGVLAPHPGVLLIRSSTGVHLWVGTLDEAEVEQDHVVEESTL